MACVFRDFGAFMAHALDEASQDAEGHFRSCDYENGVVVNEQ